MDTFYKTVLDLQNKKKACYEERKIQDAINARPNRGKPHTSWLQNLRDLHTISASCSEPQPAGLISLLIDNVREERASKFREAERFFS